MNKDRDMDKEKDFFKTCFDTVASLEVTNESQAIAKEVVLSEIDKLQQENKQLKANWNTLKEWVNKHYEYYTNEKDYIGGRLCFSDTKTKMQELEQGKGNE